MAGSNANITGPSTVAAGTSSTNFTITPSPVAITGTYTMNDGGAGGSFTPPSLTWAASTTPQTFVYNAPAMSGVKTITPVWSVPVQRTAPPTINITVTGANAAQHLYQFPQFAGVVPFQILRTNDQIPAANMPFVPPVAPVVTLYGTMEAGGGTIVGLTSGASSVIMGPIQTPGREGLRQSIFVQANGPFHLDYQFTTDGGTTWYTSKQVASVTTTLDGTLWANEARLKVVTGFQFQIQITSTVGTINANFEKRLMSRGIGGN